MIKNPEGNKMRGIRMPNELWEVMVEVAAEQGRSTTKEVILALHGHLERKGYEVTDD